MKKIIFILIGIICLSGCNMNMHKGISYSEGTFNEAVQNACELVDIEFNGEKHEYVMFITSTGSQISMSHWEGCKYCKESHEE